MMADTKADWKVASMVEMTVGRMADAKAAS
jgi:hypothetical protein